MSVEDDLRKAMVFGNKQAVQEIFDKHPVLNVNWVDESVVRGRWSLLHYTSWSDDITILKLMLGRADIDTNYKTLSGNTALTLRCMVNHLACFVLLLQHEYVNNSSGVHNHTIIRVDGRPSLVDYLTIRDQLTFLEYLIVFDNKLHSYCQQRDLANWLASMGINNISLQLLQRFLDDPTTVRYQLMLKLGTIEKLTADIFAIVIFLCDGLLQRTTSSPAGSDTTTDSGVNHLNAIRFFNIVQQLPMELQMMICYRIVGSANEIVHSSMVEPSFRELASKV